MRVSIGYMLHIIVSYYGKNSIWTLKHGSTVPSLMINMELTPAITMLIKAVIFYQHSCSLKIITNLKNLQFSFYRYYLSNLSFKLYYSHVKCEPNKMKVYLLNFFTGSEKVEGSSTVEAKKTD